MIEVQGNRHGDVLVLDELLHEVGDDLVAGLPLGGTGGALEDDRGLQLLGGVEDRGRPLEVVGVERADGVVALGGGLQHGSGVDEHVDLHTLLEKHVGQKPALFYLHNRWHAARSTGFFGCFNPLPGPIEF